MTLPTHCKTLSPADYAHLTRYVEAYETVAADPRIVVSVPHYHRRWESAIALDAIRQTKAKTILEVGSGNSPFAALASGFGYEVTVVDPDDAVNLVRQHSEYWGPIAVHQADFMDVAEDLGQFDAVACLSVIEHVEDDVAFLKRLCASAKKIVVLTMDFSPDGGRYIPQQFRTYTAESLARLGRQAGDGWKLLGDPDWVDHGVHVHDYNFASLCMVRRDRRARFKGWLRRRRSRVSSQSERADMDQRQDALPTGSKARSPEEGTDVIVDHLDTSYLVRTLSELATVPTELPLGYETFMEPDDPKLVHYVQRVIRPRLVDIGAWDLIDAPLNNLIVRYGSGESGRSLLIQNYTPAQHHNLMDDPFSGKVASARDFGRDEPAVFGQGVSQNKAHQAVMLAVLKLLHESGVELRGRLYWAVNNEGRSSHACSEAIVGALPEKPGFGIIQIGTGLKLSLGNRGRVDVIVHVRGKATHSSQPEDGLSAIDGASEVIQRLKTLDWPDEHPLFGGRHAVVYKVRYWPLAPHTLPSDAWLTIDRRLLPDDDPAAAVEEIRAAIGDLSPYEVSITRDVTMLPALVDARLPWVNAIKQAHAAEVGSELESVYGRGSFDAGGPCALGIPTVMYGASGGSGLLGPDFITISDVVTEARVLTRLILDQLG